MAKINVLSKQIAELIAAGEVVERPASVVKELVENSIDANSKKIEIEIKNGGKDFIRVTDDGCGIEKEDIKNAFLRHATSKVLSKEDLNSINTLGFRGEALASICAVSHVEIISCTRQESEGVSYNISGSTPGELAPCGCPCGTTIIVKDLFYNTPARVKFLKKDVSESNAIAALLDKIALSHPEISFKLIRDGKETLNTPGDGKIDSCIYSVYGKEFFKNLIKVEYEMNNIKINGYISKANFGRPNRNMQHFFINGRYVKCRTAMVALEQAFKGSIMIGKFPSCVLYINISPNAVDVNIHPTKLEIRFINEKPLFEAVYNCAKDYLFKSKNHEKINLGFKSDDLKNLTFNPNKIKKQEDLVFAKQNNKSENLFLKPQGDETKNLNFKRQNDEPNNLIFKKQSKKLENLNIKELEVNDVKEDEKVKDNCAEKVDLTIQNKEYDNYIEGWYLNNNSKKNAEYKKDEENLLDDSSKNELEKQYKDKYKTKENGLFNQTKVDEEPSVYARFIGEVFNTYILVELENDLMLIDKHAAHEALIYNNLKENRSNPDIQVLLAPISINLEKTEYSAIIENKNLLYDLGFEVEDFGNGTVIVRGIPTIIDIKDAKDCIIEIASHILDGKTNLTPERINRIYYTVACKAAVKGGNILDNIELISIATKTLNNPEVDHCPHGRPISFSIKKSEIERKFGRS